MAKTRKMHKNEVVLVAFDRNDAVVEEQRMSYEDYYEGLPELIDSNLYRASRGIRRITGSVYNSKGELEQDFDNKYSEKGEYLRGRAVHADGTVIEDQS